MKKIDLNKSKDLEALKESLNNVIDKKIAAQRLTEKFNDIKKLSFGEYKSLFEDTLTNLSETNNGKKCIASYVKLLKENNAIKSVYHILEHTQLTSDADPNITAYAWATILENVDKKQLKEGEKKMYGIYKTACDIVGNVTPEMIDSTLLENKTVNDAVNFLTHKSDSSNIKILSERIKSIDALKGLVREDDTVNQQPQPDTTTNTSTDTKALVSDLNNALMNEHTEWENKVLRDLSICYMSGSSTKDLFESYKTSCIEAIDSIGDDDVTTKSRLHGMKQQLMEKQYNEDTFQEDLFNLAELKEMILNE